MHDPTTLNRQNYDIGHHYRSIILYHTDEQRQLAETTVKELAQPLYPDPVVTEIKPFEKFWPADDYMQNYYNDNPSAGYCTIVIDPKISKLRQKFAAKLKPDA
jgi:peptide-methionine (S)-S-oxide reductase